MGRGEDRISYLPEPVLQNILTMMPLKSAIRTDVLSKKWRHLWKYSLSTATTLEFSKDMTSILSAASATDHLSADDFAKTVDRYMSLNGSKKLERFRIFFCPSYLFASEIERWINFAIGKGVRYLDIDLSQGLRDPKNGEFTDGMSPFLLPKSLFDCDSLTELSISRCDFCSPLNLSNFGGLKSLSISHSDIHQNMLQSVLKECPLLESLSLRSCKRIFSVRIVVPGLKLKLKKLIIRGFRSACLLRIDAPKLESFHYFGTSFIKINFFNISSVEDAIICTHIRYRRNMSLFLDILNVQTLTLSSGALMHLNEFEGSSNVETPIKYQNLHELQLLIDSMTNEDLIFIYNFFYICSFPFLEKLFIQLPKHTDDPNKRKYGGSVRLNPLNLDNTNFDLLKVIKITNFKGSMNEMSLVSFLLRKATVLETLALVIRPDKEPNVEERLDLRNLKGEVLLLRKASSIAQIILHEFGEDDDGLNPTHLEIYNEYNKESRLASSSC